RRPHMGETRASTGGRAGSDGHRHGGVFFPVRGRDTLYWGGCLPPRGSNHGEEPSGWRGPLRSCPVSPRGSYPAPPAIRANNPHSFAVFPSTGPIAAAKFGVCALSPVGNRPRGACRDRPPPSFAGAGGHCAGGDSGARALLATGLLRHPYPPHGLAVLRVP